MGSGAGGACAILSGAGSGSGVETGAWAILSGAAGPGSASAVVSGVRVTVAMTCCAATGSAFAVSVVGPSTRGCDTRVITGGSRARAGMKGLALAWTGFGTGLSIWAVPAGSRMTERPSGPSSMRYPTLRVSSTTMRVMPTLN